MSDDIISVEHVSKRYRLHHQTRERYTALRDVLTEKVKRLFGGGGAREAAPETEEDFWALNDVSFTVKRGEVVGIIGRNGAGKSTLLKILSRITEPSSGRIRISGRVASLLEVGTGFHPELTGRENIFLNGAILGMSRAEIRGKFDEIVAFAEVEKFLDTPVKRYSSGMYVRLAFAVAAHLEPEILIVDEVLAVGDVAFQRKCLGKMREVSTGGRTVLFVSHNMSAISQLCSRCVLMSGGRVAEQGPTAQTVESYLRSNSGMYSGGRLVRSPDKEKAGVITELVLMSPGGKPTNQFSCDEPITIEVRLRLRSKIAGMFCWLDFTRSDGTLVWMNDSYDAGSNLLGDLVPGEYLMRVSVPARTVGHGDYLVTLVVTGPLGGAMPIDALESVCMFRIEDLTTNRGNQRPGFLSTRAAWEIDFVQ